MFPSTFDTCLRLFYIFELDERSNPYHHTSGAFLLQPFLLAGALWTGVELDDDVYNNQDDIDGDACLGRFGGWIKYLFRDGIALSVSANYDIASEEIYADDDGNLDDCNWKMLMSLRLYAVA